MCCCSHGSALYESAWKSQAAVYSRGEERVKNKKTKCEQRLRGVPVTQESDSKSSDSQADVFRCDVELCAQSGLRGWGSDLRSSAM